MKKRISDHYPLKKINVGELFYMLKELKEDILDQVFKELNCLDQKIRAAINSNVYANCKKLCHVQLMFE